VALSYRKYSENIKSVTTQNKGKAPMPMPSYKCPHGNIGQSSHDSHGSHGSFGGKGASGSKLLWGILRMQKQTLKVL
jgi:hypothetical protein